MRSNYLKWLILTVLTLVAATAIINWAVDPFRYYHAPWIDIGYSENQRYQNAGLVRTEDYDTVLIGTSHTEHFLSADLGRSLGGRALNLSMSGSSIVEQSRLAEAVIRAGKARRILWEINYPSFSTGERPSAVADFPQWLYRPDAETPFRYLVSWDTLKESLAAVGGRRAGALDELHRWDREFDFGEDRVLANWDYMQTRWNDELRGVWRLQSTPLEQVPVLFRKYVGALVERHPDVQFDLLLLPTSRLDYVNDFQIDVDRFDKRMALRGEVARLLRSRSQVRAWDFQLIRPMTEELSRYKDLEHFDLETARSIITRIGEAAEPARADDIDRGTETLRVWVGHWARNLCERAPARCQAYLREALPAP
ncbi:MAG: hypothetical protein HKP03_01760 [Xanthomonadales bacterium]|nr:hypothetical protein [Xanthomonadales bacterium]